MSENVKRLPPQDGRLGATRAEWRQLQQSFGTEFLHPIVARRAGLLPTANSDLVADKLGKIPSFLTQDDRHFYGFDWRNHRASEEQVANWAKRPGYNAGVKTGSSGTIALDCDLGDVEESERLLAVVRRHIPATKAFRFRENEPSRWLIPVKCPVKFGTMWWDFPSGGVLEILNEGRQFMAAGTHHSGVRVQWRNLTQVAELTEEQWADFMFDLTEVAKLRGTQLFTPVAWEGTPEAPDPIAAFLSDKGLVLSEDDRKVNITCPWQASHSGQGDATETSWLRARDGMKGQFRCQHEHCSNRNAGDLEEWLVEEHGYCEFENLDAVAGSTGDDAGKEDAVDGPVEPSARLPRNLRRDNHNQILAVLHNLVLCLEVPGLYGATSLRFDEFFGTLMLDGKPLTDGDVAKIRLALERKGFKPIGKELLREALLVHQEHHRYDSAIEWLATLPRWDGVHRIERFWPVYFGVEDTPYSRAVGLYTWTALAGRVLQPGVQADMAPVLQGRQGLGKSQGIKALAPWDTLFGKVAFSHNDDDLSRKLLGKVVIELDELRGLRTRDAESIKSWITQQTEEWTPKYMERVTSYRRRCILFGTTNQDAFLDDETGERRWLPMKVGRIDRDALERDREQLWAEARLTFLFAGVIWQQAERLAGVEHLKFKVTDAWDDLVADWLAQPIGGELQDLDNEDMRTNGDLPFLRLNDVWRGALQRGEQRGAERFSMADQARLGRSLRRLGYDNFRNPKGPGKIWKRVAPL